MIEAMLLTYICTRGLTDRAIGYGPIGWGFESLRVYHKRVELSSALFFVLAVVLIALLVNYLLAALAEKNLNIKKAPLSSNRGE